MRIIKIDGDSLWNPSSLERIGELCTSRPGGGVFVLSAPTTIYGILEQIANIAPSDAEKSKKLLYSCLNAYKNLCDRYNLSEAYQTIEEMSENLNDVVGGVVRIRECSIRSSDCIRSYAVLFAIEFFAKLLESRGNDVVRYAPSEGIIFDEPQGDVLFDESYARLEILRNTQQEKKVHLVAGGIGSLKESDAITCFGPGGADLTAVLFAVAFRVDKLTLLTKKEGLFVVDPSLVSGASVIQELSMQEALELTYCGGHTIHSEALIPLETHNIDVHIKSIEKIDASGTWIRWNPPSSANPVKGISVVHDVALVVVSGRGMRGTQGTASRVFAALAQSSINAVMISQTASEQNICIVCTKSQIAQAQGTLQNSLKEDLQKHRISHISAINDVAILGVVGEHMRGRHGIAGAIFSSLGKANINVVAIAQGSSEVNISFAVAQADVHKAANTLYQEFFG